MKKNTNSYLKYNVRDYLESIVDIKDKKVLDFGCNHANFLPWTGDYTGYDIDKQVIEQNKINSKSILSSIKNIHLLCVVRENVGLDDFSLVQFSSLNQYASYFVLIS